MIYTQQISIDDLKKGYIKRIYPKNWNACQDCDQEGCYFFKYQRCTYIYKYVDDDEKYKEEEE